MLLKPTNTDIDTGSCYERPSLFLQPIFLLAPISLHRFSSPLPYYLFFLKIRKKILYPSTFLPIRDSSHLYSGVMMSHLYRNALYLKGMQETFVVYGGIYHAA
jgi:hypothetical protein